MADETQDQNKNAGGQNDTKQPGHQAPARNPNDDRSAGERADKEHNDGGDEGTEGQATGLNKGPIWADKQPGR